MIKFHNAKDVFGNTISISDVTKENRTEHYRCIGCGGEMVAVLGEHREHHFRHKEAQCSWESYLHKLGKLRLKEMFDSQEKFVIKYYIEHRCDKSEGCKIGSADRCVREELHAIDLKELYDTCEEEVTYKGFRADLMLSSKDHPEREPVFLEISVTHDCEIEKLASGISIIEIKIAEEEDVMRPLVEDELYLGQLNDSNSYNPDSLPLIRFYNFRRIFEAQKPLARFWVSKDERGILRGYWCKQDGLNCRNVEVSHRDDSIYELAVQSDYLNLGVKSINLYEFGLLRAIKAGIELRHCGLCVLYNRCIVNIPQEVVDERTGEKRQITYQRRIRMLSDQEIDKVALANLCSKYYPDNVYMLGGLRGEHYTFWEWKKSPFPPQT